MKYSFASGTVSGIIDEVVAIFVTEASSVKGPELKKLDQAARGGLSRLMETGEFTGKNGQIASVVSPADFNTKRLLLVGLGAANKLDPDCFRHAAGTLSRYRGFVRAKSGSIHFGKYSKADCLQAVIEGYLLGSFKQLDYKTGDQAISSNKLEHLQFVVERANRLAAMKKAVTTGQIIAESQLLTRRLTQTPSADLTPRLYAQEAQRLARKYGFKCKVLDEKGIAKENMGALLGVAKGSDEPPRFIILEYNGGRSGAKPVVLVGKGVTFDSGGISLKAGLNMHEMKQDMAGSAVVLATLVLAARLKLKVNVVGLMATTENMPSGHATRPGDVLKSRKGLTIEIINTDAEGRLVLADALDYANVFKPAAVIDIATLTGASLYILGYAGAPIMGNHAKLLDRVEAASKKTAERVWELPIWEDFRLQMKSPLADLVNSGGRTAGTVAAGAFLENFIGDWPWVHIDIAYVDLEPKGSAYLPKGATGFGVRLLASLLTDWKKL